MSKATPNPVQYTYSHKTTGSTAHSIPHPEPISAATYCISGLRTLVFGLSELPTNVTEVSVLWLLHPRLQTQECMAPFAAHLITSWNEHARKSRIKTQTMKSSSPSPAQSQSPRGLIAVTFDQRNHGTRQILPLANEAWRGGNPTHAQDMFSSYHGTVQDTFLLMDYLSSYCFPDNKVKIVQNMVMGISLGGHAAWQCVMHDDRIDAAIVTIGCPDYMRLLSDRARLSKRKTWSDGNGEKFLGSTDFPLGLVEIVRKWDPAGMVLSAGKKNDFGDLDREDETRLKPLMKKWFGGKRILNLTGGSDKLVPYAQGEPFLTWLKRSTTPGGFFKDGGLVFEDIVIPGAGHEVPPEMVEHMVRFLTETIENNIGTSKGRKDSSRQSRL